jgi:hypothetical protein
MKQKKNIDQLFKEGFANHQAAPASHVWDKIQVRLEKDKKDRVLAIWWRAAGVAASLALIFSIVSLLNDPQSNSIVEQQQNIEHDPNTDPKIEKAIELPLGELLVATTNKDTQNQTIKPKVEVNDTKRSKNEIIVLKKPEKSVVKLAVKKEPVVPTKNSGIAVLKPKKIACFFRK